MPYLITKGFGPSPKIDDGGFITLNNDKWMNIAVPVKGKKIKAYFVDAVLNIVRTESPLAQASDIIEVIKAFPASNESTSKYLVYVPDITPDNAEGNFNLVTTDGTNKEINGFLCKMKDYSSLYSSEIVFEWNSKDGI